MNRASGTSYRGTTFSERMAAAPCLTTDPELGYPSQDGKRGKGKEYAWLEAQKVCKACPFELRQECLDVAMKAEGTTGANGRHGVFGGLDPQERADLVKTGVYRPKMLGSDHGTAARSRAHRRAGETPCGPCLAAESDARRAHGQTHGWQRKQASA